MISNILLVYPDSQRDFFEDLRTELEAAFKDDEDNKPVVIEEHSVMRARECIQRGTRFDLVVSHIELSPEPKSPPQPDGTCKLENWLRINKISYPMVIIVPKLNNALAKRFTHPLSLVLENDRSISDAIITFAKENKRPEKQLDVVLNLQAKDDNTRWHYTIKGKNLQGGSDYSGDLEKPDRIELKNILQFTKDVDDKQTNNWKDRVELLSDNLYTILIKKNPGFLMDLNEAVRQVGKLERTRVKFIVDEKLYPVFLEAVPSPSEKRDYDGGSDYWMIHSPLVRHVSENRARLTLFQEEERTPLNVLIIGSDATWWVDFCKSKENPVRLERLDNVARECNELKQHMERLKREGINLGEIRVIPSSFNEGISTEDVKGALEAKRWDIVHYAGHSYLDENTDCAYVFFLKNDKTIDPVKIEEFAGYLWNTRLLVLSSCTSAHEGFVFELARHQIPAVLGFRNRIDDDIARQFSVEFFRSLFELRSVDGAFFMARKHLYENNATDRAWTNPVLVLESIG